MPTSSGRKRKETKEKPEETTEDNPMITEKDIQLILLQCLEAGNFAAADLEKCPWPEHVKDTIMQHTQESISKGLFKGLIGFKKQTMDFENLPIQPAGELFDEILVQFLSSYVNLLEPYRDKKSIQGSKLWELTAETFDKAYELNKADTRVKIAEINRIIFS